MVKATEALTNNEGQWERKSKVSLMCAAVFGPQKTLITSGKEIIAPKFAFPPNKKYIPIIESCFSKDEKVKMPVTKGKVGDHVVDTLHDTGCSKVIVWQEYVGKEEITNKFVWFFFWTEALENTLSPKLK